jgi:hypothetical protein
LVGIDVEDHGLRTLAGRSPASGTLIVETAKYSRNSRWPTIRNWPSNNGIWVWRI